MARDASPGALHAIDAPSLAEVVHGDGRESAFVADGVRAGAGVGRAAVGEDVILVEAGVVLPYEGADLGEGVGNVPVLRAAEQRIERQGGC